MYYLVTNSRDTDDPANFAVIQTIDTGIIHHDWCESLLASFNYPDPQPCPDDTLEDLLVDPECFADTVLLSFSSLEELALTHPEFLI